MITAFRQLRRCTRATAAVEAAIFLPIFIVLTFGITDAGSGMYIGMQVNAATQAGATYAVINSRTGSVCETTVIGPCLSGIQAVMNNAFGNSSFCSGGSCSATIGGCTDGSPKCITISAVYPWVPILPWPVLPLTFSSSVMVRTL